MSSNEKTTYLGYVLALEKDQGTFYNFYPEYKIVNKLLKKLNPEEKNNMLKGYDNINLGLNNVRVEPFGNHICMVSFSLNDINFVPKDNGSEQARLSIDDLLKNDAITVADDGKHGLYKVVKTMTSLKENWDENVWTKDNSRLLAMYDELELQHKYFLKHFNLYVGPFEYRTLSGKNGLFVPADERPAKLSQSIDITTLTIDFYDDKIIETTDEYVYYTSDTVINGEGEHKDTPPIPPIKPDNNNTDVSVKAERNRLFEEIKKYRNYEKNEIFNILICITQGFLTVFAGEPGTGKTSICDTIAKVLGLSSTEVDKNRYLSISVERGWTSKNDLIGYYNPLTEKFTDNTGLYAALTKLDNESKQNKCLEPYFVLLDEANLSQMEHYWSGFIKLADTDARRETKLHLAPAEAKDKEIITEMIVPDILKFLATINNDHTTEDLSPRLLDRAWIITLPTPEDDFENKSVDSASVCITWETLTKLFGADTAVKSATFDSAKKEIESIYALYKDNRRTVSPRSKMAIDNYLKVALNCFDGDDVVTSAIDFVIMQKLLPMLNGYIAEEFAEKLHEMLDKKYPMSFAKFEDMRCQNDSPENTYVSFFM